MKSSWWGKMVYTVCWCSWIVGSCMGVNAQTDGAPNLNTVDGMQQLRDQQTDPHARIYHQAQELGDYSTAIYALHHLLLEDPQNTYLQDSLALYYARVGNSTACLRWCDQCLSERPQSTFLLGLSAQILAAGGQIRPALDRYEALHALSQSDYDRYQIAALQFQLGRHGECLAHIEAMLEDSSVDAEMIQVSWDNASRQVSLRAALLNLRGNLEQALNQAGRARKSFRAALKIAPDFQLARNNLQAMDAREREERGRNGR